MGMPTGTSTDYDVNKKNSGILMILVSENSPKHFIFWLGRLIFPVSINSHSDNIYISASDKPSFTLSYLSMAPPKDHAVSDLLIFAKLEFIWFICCILMENS